MTKKTQNRKEIGRKARLKGLRNQRKTVKYILENYPLFGVTEKNRIFTAGTRAKRGGTDIFGLWDIIVMPDIPDYWTSLVQVKTNIKSGTAKAKKVIRELQNFTVPPNTQKFLVVWYDRKPKPLVLYIPNKTYDDRQTNCSKGRN